VQRFPGELVFKVHGLFVSLSSRLESNNEEERVWYHDGKQPWQFVCQDGRDKSAVGTGFDEWAVTGLAGVPTHT